MKTYSRLPSDVIYKAWIPDEGFFSSFHWGPDLLFVWDFLTASLGRPDDETLLTSVFKLNLHVETLDSEGYWCSAALLNCWPCVECAWILIIWSMKKLSWSLQVWVKPAAEMSLLYGNHVLKSGLGRITESTPTNTGVVLYSMSDVPLGFGVTAKSTAECRSMEPSGIVVLHQADVGEFTKPPAQTHVIADVRQLTVSSLLTWVDEQGDDCKLCCVQGDHV